VKRLRDERGSVLILGIGAVAVCLLALVVLVDASAAFLQRRTLVSLADAAALAGAQGIDLADYYANGASPATRLDPAVVPIRVRTFLAESTPVEGLRLESLSTDGRTVRVVLSAPLRLPFRDGAALLSAVGPGRVTVEAYARMAYAAAG
jgi:hypothetical protein